MVKENRRLLNRSEKVIKTAVFIKKTAVLCIRLPKRSEGEVKLPKSTLDMVIPCDAEKNREGNSSFDYRFDARLFAGA